MPYDDIYEDKEPREVVHKSITKGRYLVQSFNEVQSGKHDWQQMGSRFLEIDQENRKSECNNASSLIMGCTVYNNMQIIVIIVVIIRIVTIIGIMVIITLITITIN